MSPLKPTLLPVANIVVWHSQSGRLVAPEHADLDHRPLGHLAQKLAVEIMGQLSSDTIGLPSSSTALIRFSVSSALREAVMTGHRRPVAIVAITSTR